MGMEMARPRATARSFIVSEYNFYLFLLVLVERSARYGFPEFVESLMLEAIVRSACVRSGRSCIGSKKRR